MKRIALAISAAAVAVTVAFSGSAFAVGINPNDAIVHPLDGSTQYNATPAPATGNINDVYLFSVVAPVSTLLQVQVLANFPPPGIQNLTFTWRDALNNTISQLVFTDAAGNANLAPGADKLSQILGTGAYSLLVTGFGFAGPTGPPHYDFNISETGATPLPGAALLFGSVVGGIGGVQLMRRRRQVAR
jgi:hypothetical protein